MKEFKTTVFLRNSSIKMWLKPFSVIKNNLSNFIVGIVLFSCIEWLGF